jgi:tetratricopeptide (TPR) repeat protein
MTRFFSLAFLSLLLMACASQDPVQSGTGDMKVATAPVEPEVEPVERPFPENSLYPLLVAEFALRRRAYEIALENYLAQAPVLQDPGISAHTTHLAQFLQREPEALEAVQLWVELEPDNLEANNTLAILLVRRGRNLEAAAHLAVVARGGDEANFPVLLNGFKQLDPTGKARLVTAINELAAEFPEDPQILLTQALLLEELGQSEQALTKLDELFELDPYQNQAILPR